MVETTADRKRLGHSVLVFLFASFGNGSRPVTLYIGRGPFKLSEMIEGVEFEVVFIVMMLTK